MEQQLVLVPCFCAKYIWFAWTAGALSWDTVLYRVKIWYNPFIYISIVLSFENTMLFFGEGECSAVEQNETCTKGGGRRNEQVRKQCGYGMQ